VTHLDVLIAGSEADAHCRAVADYLRVRHLKAVCLSMSDLPRAAVNWKLREVLSVCVGAEDWTINNATAVWWRRPGTFDSETLNKEERDLVSDELAVIWPGVSTPT